MNQFDEIADVIYNHCISSMYEDAIADLIDEVLAIVNPVDDMTGYGDSFINKLYATEDKDTMVKLEGQSRSFRCSCGCNVFKKLVNPPLRYKCNACNQLYQGER